MVGDLIERLYIDNNNSNNYNGNDKTVMITMITLPTENENIASYEK